MQSDREELIARVVALIDRLAASGRDDPARDALLIDIARWQVRHVAPYRRLAQARGVDVDAARSPDDLPALPTDVFRATRVAAHPPVADIRTFLTSGTTSGSRGAAHLCDLTLYNRSAQAAAARALFPDCPPRLQLLSLVANEQASPESSLSYMVARFHEWFGTPDSRYAWRDGQIDIATLRSMLDEAVRANHPIVLLGTSFAFVFAEDALGETTWQLPQGSRIMQTGGYKGRVREVQPDEMLSLLSRRFGVPKDRIIAEYGMTELSSQMYENTLANVTGTQRCLEPPPWVRVSLVDPETLRPIDGDAVGLVRIDDPANVDTACAVQTSDFGRRVGDTGFVLEGRAAGAVLRGCSLAVEEAMRP